VPRASTETKPAVVGERCVQLTHREYRCYSRAHPRNLSFPAGGCGSAELAESM
jgi:hypothetical protein